METRTLEQIRKRASELKIKNYTRLKGPELLKLIEEIEGRAEQVLVKKVRKPREMQETPREGTQAMEIYKLFEAHRGHKKWTAYRVAKETGFPKNNVERVFKRWFKGK